MQNGNKDADVGTLRADIWPAMAERYGEQLARAVADETARGDAAALTRSLVAAMNLVTAKVDIIDAQQDRLCDLVREDNRLKAELAAGLQRAGRRFAWWLGIVLALAATSVALLIGGAS